MQYIVEQIYKDEETDKKGKRKTKAKEKKPTLVAKRGKRKAKKKGQKTGTNCPRLQKSIRQCKSKRSHKNNDKIQNKPRSD